MIQIVDYKAGNLTSVQRALNFLDIPNQITADPDVIADAEKVIFPGVGHAQAAMETLKTRELDLALAEAFHKGTPILGICLGTQIILGHSDEGDTSCLGLLPGNCLRFSLNDMSLKVPHMGWDSIELVRTHPVLKGMETGDEFYFVHSYYPLPDDRNAIIATCNYEITFPAVIGKGHLIATQFHPEKSGPAGLKLLKNFSMWDGSDA